MYDMGKNVTGKKFWVGTCIYIDLFRLQLFVEFKLEFIIHIYMFMNKNKCS